jgi:predicted MFS family arabinose efflux permease
VAVIVALWRIEIPSPAAGAGSLASSLRAGLSHVRGSRVLRTLTLLALAASFLAFPLITYLPVIAGERLQSGSAGYSLLLSSFGVGAILGAVLTAQRGPAPGRGKLMLGFWLAYGVCVVAAVLSRRQGVAMALLFVAGACTVSAFSTLNSLVQEHAPPELRGRVLGIYGLCFRGGMPLGSLVAGALAGPFGAAAVVGSFAAALALLAATLRLRHRGLQEL